MTTPGLARGAAAGAGGLDIAVIRDGGFRDDVGLKRELHELCRPSYDDPSAVIERELAHCDTLYLGRERTGRLSCFFLIAWETIVLDGERLPALYAGLTAVREGQKDSGTAYRLYATCGLDLLAADERHGRPVVVWGTAATPAPYYAIAHFCGGIEPALDGSFSEKGAALARAIRAQRGYPPCAPGAHPFVVRGVATATRYSPEERARIGRVCERRDFRLLELLEIREEAGDRFIFISRVPE